MPNKVEAGCKALFVVPWLVLLLLACLGMAIAGSICVMVDEAGQLPCSITQSSSVCFAWIVYFIRKAQ